MCFCNEDVWHAEVVEKSYRTVDMPTRCDECYRDIPVGGTVHEIDFQEHEECHLCFSGDCSCPDGGCCVCPEPEYGERDHYQSCEDCELFLKAVEVAEKEAGCEAHESRPAYSMMIEDIAEGGVSEALKYFKAAVRMYPQLKASGYLAFLWMKMFL